MMDKSAKELQKIDSYNNYLIMELRNSIVIRHHTSFQGFHSKE